MSQRGFRHSRALIGILIQLCLLPAGGQTQFSSTAFAQSIETNITSSGLNTAVVPPSNGSATTTIQGGTLSPNHANLFHSFGEFSIGQGDTAAFHNLNAQGTAPLVDNASSVVNIVGRVTGANPSSIFGTINSSNGFPAANLFLINPRGIVFGPGASIDVGGAVYFSTADYLRLGTGDEFFYADLAKNSTLSSAPASAFGFLGANPIGTQAIELTGSTNLTMAADQDIAFVGRDTINGVESIPGISLTQARVTSPGGQVSLVSVGVPMDQTAGGEVSAGDFSPATVSSGHGFATLGEIRMIDNAAVSVGDSSGPAVGAIVIRGGQLTMDAGSRLLARAGDANTASGTIDIHVTGPVTLRGASTIDSEVGGNSAIQGGDILIQAGSLTVTEGSQITAMNSSGNQNAAGGHIDITAATVTLSGAIDGGGNTVSSGLYSGADRISSGSSGRIRVTTNELSVLDGAAIDTSTFSNAHAGDIEIIASTVRVSGVNTTNGITSPSSTITSKATWDRQADNPNQEQQNTGTGGTIRIQTDILDIRDGGQLNTSTETAGNAGIIDVVADSIVISGGRGVTRSGITARSEFSGSPGGNGGNVSLTATTLSVTAGGAVELGTSGGGSGGQLSVNAGEITITTGGIIASDSRGNGTAGSLSLSAQSFTMTDADSRLSIRTSGLGNGGTITLNAEHALLGPGSTIDSRTSSTGSRADPTMQATGGDVKVWVGNNLSLHGARITASSSGFSSAGHTSMAVGNAGTIDIRGAQVQLSGGAEITGSTHLSTGSGGTVTVAGTGSTGSVIINGGIVQASTSGIGRAGNVLVTGNTVNLAGNTSTIDSSTTGTGHAGSVTVQADHVSLANGATIGSAGLAQATGNAGTVTIRTTGRFHSTGGNVTTSAGHGGGGDITIQSQEILLNGGAVVAASTTGPMDAGDVVLRASDRIMLQDSTVTTSAAQASGGNITMLAPNLIRLRNGQVISSVQGGPGTSGGNITIDPQAVLVQNGSRILAQAVQGNGGNIHITAGVLIVDGTSQIDASSQLGINGQVSLQAPLRNLAGVITPLPQSLISQANLYGQRCAAQKGGQFSSFVQGTRDGLPVQPGDFVPSPLIPVPAGLTPQSIDVSALPNVTAARLGMASLGQFPFQSGIRFSGCRS